MVGLGDLECFFSSPDGAMILLYDCTTLFFPFFNF